MNKSAEQQSSPFLSNMQLTVAKNLDDLSHFRYGTDQTLSPGLLSKQIRAGWHQLYDTLGMSGFTRDNLDSISHDVNPVLSLITLIASREEEWDSIGIPAKVMARIMQTILPEDIAQRKPFDISSPIADVMSLFRKEFQLLFTPDPKRQHFPPNLKISHFNFAGRSLMADTNPDVYSRILYNFVRNGTKAVEARARREEHFEGEVVVTMEDRPNTNTIETYIVDNGYGFSDYFTRCGIGRRKEYVSIQELAERGRRYSGFKAAGGEGSGRGLVICRDLAASIDAVVEVKNPHYISERVGSIVRVIIPGVRQSFDVAA